MRRRCLAYVSLLVCAATPAAGSRPAGPLVHAPAGTVRGVAFGKGEPTVFRGIPYAEPPLGQLRWRAPQPMVRWQGTREAAAFGPPCMQKVIDSRLPWTEEFMVHGKASEDCLTLNLWAPAKAAKPAAVLVFFHGGGFTEGSGAVAAYDGTALARAGILVVTVNYRLGVFGFFASSALAAESPQHVAGNYGLLDQVAALQWVRHNIAAFGGDPTRVTIAGQSAGAQSVLALMASPLAKGLFQAAIADSGAAYSRTSRTSPLAEAEQAGDRWSAQHGSILALRAIPADTLLMATDLPRESSRPVVDGHLLPLGLVEELTDPQGSDVPVITGWNADEGSSSPSYGKLSPVQFREQAGQQYGNQATQFLQLYPATDQAEATESQKQVARDRTSVAAARWAVLRSAHRRSPVYLYSFQRTPPWLAHPEFGAHHTAELPYFFGSLSQVHRDYTQEDRILSRAMLQAWVSFVDLGKPPADWPSASHPAGPFFVFDTVSGSQQLPAQPERQRFWTAVLENSSSQ